MGCGNEFLPRVSLSGYSVYLSSSSCLSEETIVIWRGSTVVPGGCDEEMRSALECCDFRHLTIVNRACVGISSSLEAGRGGQWEWVGVVVSEPAETRTRTSRLLMASSHLLASSTHHGRSKGTAI